MDHSSLRSWTHNGSTEVPGLSYEAGTGSTGFYF